MHNNLKYIFNLFIRSSTNLVVASKCAYTPINLFAFIKIVHGSGTHNLPLGFNAISW